MLLQSKTTKTLVLVSSAGIAVAALAGCSKDNSNPTPTSASPTITEASPTASPTVSPAANACTNTAITAVLPKGTTVIAYKCAGGYAGGTSSSTSGGKKSGFILKSENGKWVVVTGSVCGAASAGLPPEILAYCTAPTS